MSAPEQRASPEVKRAANAVMAAMTVALVVGLLILFIGGNSWVPFVLLGGVMLVGFSWAWSVKRRFPPT